MEVFMDYEIMMNGNVRIGQMAPDFEATTTMGNICLSDYKGKWVVLFSHPGDFTPVWAYNLGKYKNAWYCWSFSVWKNSQIFKILYYTIHLPNVE